MHKNIFSFAERKKDYGNSGFFGEKKVVFLRSHSLSPSETTAETQTGSHVIKDIIGAYGQSYNWGKEEGEAFAVGAAVIGGTAYGAYKTLGWVVAKAGGRALNEKRISSTPELLLTEKNKKRKNKLLRNKLKKKQNLVDYPDNPQGVVENIRVKIKDKLQPSSHHDEINYNTSQPLSSDVLETLEARGVKSFLKTVNKTFQNAGLTLKLTADDDVAIEKLREIQMFILKNADNFNLKESRFGTTERVFSAVGHVLHIGDATGNENVTSRGFKTSYVGKNPDMILIADELRRFENSRKEKSYRAISTKKGKEFSQSAWNWTGGHVSQKAKDLWRADANYMDDQIKNPSSLVSSWSDQIFRQDKNKQTNNIDSDVLDGINTKKYAELINKGLRSHNIKIRLNIDSLGSVRNKQLRDFYFYIVKNGEKFGLNDLSINRKIYFEQEPNDVKDSIYKYDLFVGENPNQKEFENILNSKLNIEGQEKVIEKNKNISEKNQRIFLANIRQMCKNDKIELSEIQEKAKIYVKNLTIEDIENNSLQKFCNKLVIKSDIITFLTKISEAENKEERGEWMTEDKKIYQSFTDENMKLKDQNTILQHKSEIEQLEQQLGNLQSKHSENAKKQKQNEIDNLKIKVNDLEKKYNNK